MNFLLNLFLPFPAGEITRPLYVKHYLLLFRIVSKIGTMLLTAPVDAFDGQSFFKREKEIRTIFLSVPSQTGPWDGRPACGRQVPGVGQARVGRISLRHPPYASHLRRVAAIPGLTRPTGSLLPTLSCIHFNSSIIHYLQNSDAVRCLLLPVCRAGTGKRPWDGRQAHHILRALLLIDIAARILPTIKLIYNLIP